MAQDWKDMLSSLADKLPAGEELTANAEDRHPEHHDSLRILFDKKGRKGKVATIIEGFTLSDEEVEEIASELKKKIGTGGSARGGEILLQGDWRQKAMEILKSKGFRVCCI